MSIFPNNDISQKSNLFREYIEDMYFKQITLSYKF